MTLIKTSLLNGIAVFIKMLTLLGVNKIIAVYVGPAGYAVVGQFQNAIQMVTTFGTGAINTGVIKYTSEYHDNFDEQKKLWNTSGSIILYCSMLCSISIFIFNKELAVYFLKSKDYKDVFTYLALSIPFLTFNAFFLSILNGRKEIKRLVASNIFGSLFSIAIIFLLANFMELKGILIALATYQSCAFLATYYFCRRLDWFRLSCLIGSIDRSTLKNLVAYALMAFVAAISSPMSQIFVRDILSNTLSIEFAGYWEAMWRFSSAYLMFATTTLGVYFLPKLSSIESRELIFNEIKSGYKLVLPLLVCTSITIFFMRDFLIITLFTPDFIPMKVLFFYQLVGDTLKVGGWIVAFVMLSKAMVKEYIITQVGFSILFPVLTYVLTSIIGFEGVAIAHAINYALYWALVSYLVNKRLI